MPEPDIKPDNSNPNPNPNPEPNPAPEPSWRDTLPETIRGEKTLTKFKDVGALATSYVNLEKHAGSAIRIPGENATAEERTAFLRKLGVPEKPEDYGIETKVPEGLPWNKDAELTFLRKFHAHGLTKAQAEGILNDYLAFAQESFDQSRQARAQSADGAHTTLRKEWGGLTDRNVALVQRGVQEFGADLGFKDWLDETGAGNDPRFFKFMLRVLQPMVEDNLIKGENLGMKREDAKTEIKRLMGESGYLKGDKQIIERIRELTSLAYAE